MIFPDLTFVDYIDMLEKLFVTKNGLDELKTQFGKTVTAYYNNGSTGEEGEKHFLTESAV